MKKVLKFVKGKKDEKKEGGGITQSQSGELISPAQTPEDERFLQLDSIAGYIVDFSGKDKSLTKLHKAAWLGNLEKLKSALKKIEIDSVDRRNRTALHFAVVKGHPNIVWFLLGNNAKTDICDDEGRTPLLKAIECGHKECMTLLIERGADVNVADYAGNTGLHIATGQGWTDIVSVLLKNGADTDVSNNAGDYPLHISTKLENKELVDFLLKYEASVDVLDRENRTPLMLAAKTGNVILARLFFERGAQSKIVDSNGWTALDYAVLSGHESVAATLKSLGKKEETKPEAKETAEPESVKSDESNDSWSHSKEETSEKDQTTQKLQYLLRKCSKEEGEFLEKDKSDGPPDSPSAEVMPPYCQPPRSWEIIQAGMIDENKTGAESKRRSITALGTLHSRRESFTEVSGTASPIYTLSLNRKKQGKVNNSFAKQRFSFNEEGLLKYWIDEDKSVRKESEKDEATSEQNPSTSESDWDVEIPSSMEVPKEDKAAVVETISSPEGTLGRSDTMRQVEEMWVGNPCLSPSELTSEGKQKNELYKEATFDRCDNFPPPPTALELGVDMARSIKYMKGVSEDYPAGSIMEKNLWKKVHGHRSMDYLEEKEATAGVRKNGFEERTDEDFGVEKWKIEDISKCQKPWAGLFDLNKRINEQLECYDQALRELAESSSDQKVSGPHGYYSLPFSKTKDFEVSRRTNSLNRDQEKKFLENHFSTTPNISSSTKPELSSNVETESHNSEPGEPGQKLGKQTKKHMLLTMREIKHAVHVANTFKNSSEDQVLSPLAKPEPNFDKEEESETVGSKSIKDISSPVVKFQKEVVENRKSSSSSTGEEPTFWLQEEAQQKRTNSRAHDSEEEVSEISEEGDGKHNRKSSFSPLGVIYKEIEKERQNAEGQTPGRRLREESHGANDGDEVIGEQSPDVSLSSGPIEPIGAEKDSGSEPESSHNDITPAHTYSLKAQHEWLKSHLKTATSEKSKLEEVTAHLSEKTERLQYELADAKEAAKSRDEVIQLLQSQLARMEAAYTKSLEESVQSRLQLTSHEQEILHLKELCYKYEEEKSEIPMGDLEELELRIKTLEEEKRKMKEKILNLEQEKSSLEEKLKKMIGSDSTDHCQRWKERWSDPEEKSEAGQSAKEADLLQAAKNEHFRLEAELREKNYELEKNLARINEENLELRSKLHCLVAEAEHEKAKRKKTKESVSELKKKNLEMEEDLKKMKTEIEEIKEKNLKEREDEIQALTNRFLEEKESLVNSYEKLVQKEREDEVPIKHQQKQVEAPAEKPPETEDKVVKKDTKFQAEADFREIITENRQMKNELIDLKSRMNFLVALLVDRRPDGNTERKLSREGLEGGRASKRKGVGRKNELAWSFLYGIKSSGGPEDGDSPLEMSEDEDRKTSRPGPEKDHSTRSLEFLKLKRELLVLQSKMAEERNLRQALETQIVEMNLDLSEKQNLEHEVNSLKRKIDRESAQRFEADLLRYQKDLESRREKYLEDGEERSNTDQEYKLKCETLAKEREKSKAIRNKLWKKSKSLDGGEQAPPVAQPRLHSYPWPPSQAELLPTFALEPDIKSKLEEQLDKSIKKYMNDTLPPQSILNLKLGNKTSCIFTTSK